MDPPHSKTRQLWIPALAATGLVLLLAAGAALWLFNCILVPTEFAPGYSHWRFSRIREGMTKHQVLNLVRKPLSTFKPPVAEYWIYQAPGTPPQVTELKGPGVRGWHIREDPRTIVSFDWRGRVYAVAPIGDHHPPELLERVRSGMSREQVLKVLGVPAGTQREREAEVWAYSRPARGRSDSYLRRIVCFDKSGRVVHVTREVWWD